jgi:hypothetical protein
MLEHLSSIILTLCIVFLCSCIYVPTDHVTTSRAANSPVTTSQAANFPITAPVAPSSEFLARPPQRIAIIVLRWSGYNSYGRQIEDIFIKESISKGYRVVSRSDIEPLLQEMGFQKHSGLTDKDAAELGRMLNVPAVVIVAITRDERDASALGVRLISVEEAEVLWANAGGKPRVGYSPNTWLSYSPDTLFEVAKAVANTIPQYPGNR